MNTIVDIKIWELALGFLLLAFPLAFFYYFRICMQKDILINAGRMAIQLSLVAIYLEFIFKLNNALLNSLWVIIMIAVGVLTVIRRVGLSQKHFILPFFIAGLTSILIIDAFCLGFVLKLDYVFEARYFIPITGMVLGNALNHNIVGLNTYFIALNEKRGFYRFLLTNTGNPKITLRPFIEEAARAALNPMIANMSVVGLVTLPGMMTGQILGGSPPAVAIRYQIMIMLAIFTGNTLNLFLSIILSNKIIFDGYGNIKNGLIIKKKGIRKKGGEK